MKIFVLLMPNFGTMTPILLFSLNFLENPIIGEICKQIFLFFL